MHWLFYYITEILNKELNDISTIPTSQDDDSQKNPFEIWFIYQTDTIKIVNIATEKSEQTVQTEAVVSEL